MSPEIQTLCVLGTLAATAKVARVSLESKPRLIDWLALGSVALLLMQLTSMIVTRTF